jgi:hypothetical protein
LELGKVVMGDVVVEVGTGRVLSITRAEAAPFITNAQNLANDFDVLIAQLNALYRIALKQI